jgi:MFS family permease
MSLLRWLPTFLAFPLAGLIAMLVVGSKTNPLTALAAGAIVGAVVGGAQWLALGRATDWRWGAGTVAAAAIGGMVSMFVAGPPVTPVAASVTGLITGALVGLAQGFALVRRRRRRLRVLLLWTTTVAVSWTAGWLITSAVIVDLDRGHAVFGASGALLVTAVTGVVLRLLLGPRVRRTPGADDLEHDKTMDAAASVISGLTAKPGKDA